MSLKTSTKAEFLNDLFGIAGELSDAVNDDGTPITNREQLLRLLWRTALGWTEKVRDDSGKEREIKHPPMSWAMELVLAMSVGKPTAMAPDQVPGLKAKDKVSELARDRINALTKKAMGEAKPTTASGIESSTPAVVVSTASPVASKPPKHRRSKPQHEASPVEKGESNEQQ